MLVVLTVAGCTQGASSNSTANSDPSRDASRRFLDAYVEPDGRVVRHDQGGDTVSEGQAYALLIAQAAGDNARFDLIWSWTEENLMRDDGLLSSHTTASGQVDDKNSAADADVPAAWALLRDKGPSADKHHAAGDALATAILEHETVELENGSLALAAGNWANGSPATLNPSYWALPAFAQLAEITGDERWSDLEASSSELVSQLTGNGKELPPDWARVDGAHVAATPPASGQVPDVRYSLDAQRVVVWFALGGSDASSMASAWSTLLEGEARQSMALHTDGTVIDGSAHALPLVAAASTVDGDKRDALLDEAEKVDQQHPTYYGSAWVALGRTLLTTDVFALS